MYFSLRFFSVVAAICITYSILSGTVSAQQIATAKRVGVLLGGLSPQSKEAQQLREGLREAGYIEGRDLIIEWRSAGGDPLKVDRLAAELVALKVDAIVATGTASARAAKRATSKIPIVFTVVADPIGSDLVGNLAHPAGNVTGLSNMLAELSAKRLELLKEAIPDLTKAAVLWNPKTPWHTKALQDLKSAARLWSIELRPVAVSKQQDLRDAFFEMRRGHVGGLYVLDDALFLVHRASVIKLASTVHLPAVYGARDFSDDGGLMSYGADYSNLYRRAATYVDKILRGTNPGDLQLNSRLGSSSW